MIRLARFGKKNPYKSPSSKLNVVIEWLQEQESRAKDHQRRKAFVVARTEMIRQAVVRV